MSDAQQRRQLDLLEPPQPATTSSEHADEAELAARIESFELAYRMQMAAPEALDVSTRAGRRSRSSTASTTRAARTSPSSA